MKKIINRFAFVFVLFMLSGCSIVEDHLKEHIVGIDQALYYLKQNFDAINHMLTAVAFLVGFAFVFSAVHKLRVYGEVRTMMPSNAEMLGPLMKFLIGILLIYLPSVIKISVYSLWNDDPLQYTPGGEWYSVIESACFGVIQIFGFISVIRGLIHMARSTQQGGGQQGTFGKGLIHFIGGILAINIYGTVNIIEASFGKLV